MSTSNTIAVEASDDIAVLALFERLAISAGRAVLDVFKSDIAVSRKDDSSPVTEADRTSERIILEGLRAALPSVHCVAEEECSEGIVPPDLGAVFLLVDPFRRLHRQHRDDSRRSAGIGGRVRSVGSKALPRQTGLCRTGGNGGGLLGRKPAGDQRETRD